MTKKQKEVMSIDGMTLERHMTLVKEQRKALKESGRKYW